MNQTEHPLEVVDPTRRGRTPLAHAAHHRRPDLKICFFAFVVFFCAPVLFCFVCVCVCVCFRAPTTRDDVKHMY